MCLVFSCFYRTSVKSFTGSCLSIVYVEVKGHKWLPVSTYLKYICRFRGESVSRGWKPSSTSLQVNVFSCHSDLTIPASQILTMVLGTTYLFELHSGLNGKMCTCVYCVSSMYYFLLFSVAANGADGRCQDNVGISSHQQPVCGPTPVLL